MVYLNKQQYQRMVELCQLSRQRYLEAGGNPKLSSGTLHHNDYLTDTEKQEFFQLGKQLTTNLDYQPDQMIKNQ
jgi:hypothetical protein